jgi:hypothetical protein
LYRAVGEDSRHACLILLEARALRTKYHIVLARLFQQEALQIGPVNSDARCARASLQFPGGHLGERLPTPGADLASRRGRAELAYLMEEAEFAQRSNGIRGQQYPGTNRFDLSRTLEHGRLYARPAQRDGRRKAAYASAHDHRSHTCRMLPVRHPCASAFLPDAEKHHRRGDAESTEDTEHARDPTGTPVGQATHKRPARGHE